MAVAIGKRRFTADECQRMLQLGILSENDRVELIDGELVAKMSIGPRHLAAVDRANRAFVLQAGDDAIVRVQGSVRLDLYSEPEPDLVLLRPKPDFYATAHPGPADVLLIVEVAQSSIDYDRDVKGPLYARLGVHEYWLADLNENVLLCYSDPRDGRYRSVTQHRCGSSIAPQLLPTCLVAVDLFLTE